MALNVVHQDTQEPCPFLPFPVEPMTSDAIKSLAGDRGVAFYETALRYAQSLWLQGFPARALLLINRALASDLDGNESLLQVWPVPYAATGWIMMHRPAGQFIGNPRRHYQHLATRMVEPRKEQRTWRAWACWFLSRVVLSDLPADEEQIATEGIVEPGEHEITDRLITLGWAGEAEHWQYAVRYLRRPQ